VASAAGTSQNEVVIDPLPVAVNDRIRPSWQARSPVPARETTRKNVAVSEKLTNTNSGDGIAISIGP